MWKCHKCGKPVYFAERKQSLGYDWHPECLRCEECGKRLNPGQHAEHKGVPYCHVPCYGALFGPQLFGHGTRVESHKSFGLQKDIKIGNGPSIPRAHIENKLKLYNQFFDGKSGGIRSREVNGRLILEGSLRIHWGVQGVIHLKEDDDQRTVVTIRKRNSCRLLYGDDFDSDEEVEGISRDSSFNDISVSSNNSNSELNTSLSSLSLDTVSVVSDTGIESGEDTSESTTVVDSPVANVSLRFNATLPPKLNPKTMEWDELDDLLQVERQTNETDKLYQTMPTLMPSKNLDSPDCVSAPLFSLNGMSTQSDLSKTPTDEKWMENGNHLNRSMSGPDCLERMRYPQSPEFDQISIDSTNTDISNFTNQDDVVVRRPKKTGSTAIKRRTGKRLSRIKVKRRCSINGHFYNRETSFFTPPHGSQMSVWVTSLVNTQDVVNLILEKYKVESEPNNFALFMVHDNGEQKRIRDEDYPLLVRVLNGPHEDVVRIFLMDSHNTPEVSNEVAQFLNFSLTELKAILNQYYGQEEKEIFRIQNKFFELKRRIKQRMEELKVRL